MSEAGESLQRLIDEARKSHDAINELLQLFRNYLSLLARACMDRRMQAKADASDVVQLTLLKAYEHFDQFKGHTEAELTAWRKRAAPP